MDGEKLDFIEASLISEDVKSELHDMSGYYCTDVCEYRGKYCDECPVESFLVWLDTQTDQRNEALPTIWRKGTMTCRNITNKIDVDFEKTVTH